MEDINTFAIQQFLKYVKINSQSDPNTHVTPSTQCQYDMQKELMKDLKELGVEYKFDEKNCLLIGEIPARGESKKSIGFICHVDTSSEAPGSNVKPLIHQLPETITEDLQLPHETVIAKEDLKDYAGKKIITSSGDTLLGADDKSGVAMVMGMVERIQRENIPHPRIMIIFTPDEEIGQSCNNIKVEELKLDYAYAIDGKEVGEYSDEGFNAFGAELKIIGHEVHPGDAFNIMEDAGHILCEFNMGLPQSKRPETTKDNEGYILCTRMNGCVTNAEAKYIIRSFSVTEMEYFIQLMKDEIERLKRKYTKSHFEINFVEQYRNPKRYLPDDTIIEKFIEACDKANVKAFRNYMRGGSDSSRLSQMGLPSITTFAGGINFHSKREFVPVEAINIGVDVLSELVKLF